MLNCMYTTKHDFVFYVFKVLNIFTLFTISTNHTFYMLQLYFENVYLIKI